MLLEIFYSFILVYSTAIGVRKIEKGKNRNRKREEMRNCLLSMCGTLRYQLYSGCGADNEHFFGTGKFNF